MPTDTLRDLRLRLREELERHTKAMAAIDRQLSQLLGDLKPRPKVVELVSPSGQTSPVKPRGM